MKQLLLIHVMKQLMLLLWSDIVVSKSKTLIVSSVAIALVNSLIFILKYAMTCFECLDTSSLKE